MSLRSPLLLSTSLLTALALPAQGDNVLLITMDDIGVDGIAAYNLGSNPPPTPNLTSLANNGVLFRHAYAQSTCTPTRAALHTGRYAFRTGIGQPGGSLPLAETILPEILPSHYAHALLGKWHLGNPTANYPNRMGWGHYAGALGAEVQDYFNWTKTTNGQSAATTTYATTDTVNDALAWINAQTGAWVLALNFNAPHAPFHTPPAALHTYNLQGRDPQRNPTRFYKAAVQAMDMELGRLLAQIHATTLARTNILVLGDNGTPTNVLQAPFRGPGKGTTYEAGVHVPLIVSGPIVQNPGRESMAFVEAVDLFHTIAELTGVDARAAVPAQVELDGISLVPYLTDPNQASLRSFAFAEQFGTRVDDMDGIRDDRYKLVAMATGDELFDLQADPFEQNDLLRLPLSPSAVDGYNRLRTEISKIRGTAAWFGFGRGCAGAAGLPTLAPFPNSRPVLGTTFAARVGNLHSTVTQCIGMLALAPIHLDLSPFGAPGCILHTDLSSLTTLSSSMGSAPWLLPIPPAASLVGVRFYQQAIVFEPGVNIHGAILTNGAVGVVEAL